MWFYRNRSRNRNLTCRNRMQRQLNDVLICRVIKYLYNESNANAQNKSDKKAKKVHEGGFLAQQTTLNMLAAVVCLHTAIRDLMFIALSNLWFKNVGTEIERVKSIGSSDSSEPESKLRNIPSLYILINMSPMCRLFRISACYVPSS